ncbi:hypothetical protein ACSBL2_11390 [Pedobacter sp. AW31-3R]|uniref:hypothetical protein n=1 Tax=Pedobacter sp. AW31-3R TaxID=3445781 RepID=UPI003FA06DAB
MIESNEEYNPQKLKEVTDDLLKKQIELLEKTADSNRKLDDLRERTRELLHHDDQSYTDN